MKQSQIEHNEASNRYFKLKEDGVIVARTQELVEKNIWKPVKELLKDEMDTKQLEMEMERSFLSSLNELKQYR